VAEHYEWLYVQRYQFYPDEEFAWNERIAMFVESRGGHSKCDESACNAVQDQNRNIWQAERKKVRDTWARVQSGPGMRQGPAPTGPPPPPLGRGAGPQPQDPNGTSEQNERRIREEHLAWVFNHPLSSWETRQEAINSPADCHCFLKWIQENYPPEELRRRERLKELLDTTKESGEMSRRICRAVIQIYHPDSNVDARPEWRNLAEQITRVFRRILRFLIVSRCLMT